MVALDEDGANPARGHRAGQHACGVLEDALERVGLFRSRQLEDDGGRVVLLGSLEDYPRHVERLGAQVDGRDGHPFVLAASTSVVELLDAGRSSTDGLAGFPDDPASGFDRGFVLAERSGPGEVVDAARPEAVRVDDDETLSLDPRDAVEGGEKLLDGAGNLGHCVQSPEMPGDGVRRRDAHTSGTGVHWWPVNGSARSRCTTMPLVPSAIAERTARPGYVGPAQVAEGAPYRWQAARLGWNSRT